MPGTADHPDYELRLWSGQWRIEAFWYAFDVHGTRDQFTAWVGDPYDTEAEARDALAKLQGGAP